MSIKIGIVGLQVGKHHAIDYLNSPDKPELVLCDIHNERLSATAKQLGIKKQYADFSQMLASEHLNAVSIAVPNFLHKPFVMQALQAGCHVLCEKPMALSAGEAAEMLQAAENAGKKLLINFNQRFEHPVWAAKQLALNGRFGNIYYVLTVWHRRRGIPFWYPLENAKETCGGGPLVDLGSHVLDRALWICGFPRPDWVLGTAYNRIGRAEGARNGIKHFSAEDMATAFIRFENGSSLFLETSWAANREKEEVITEIYGDKGGARLYASFSDPFTADFRCFLQEENGTLTDYNLLSFPHSSAGIRQHFLDVILRGTQPLCTPEEGLCLCRLTDAIYRSAELGAPVKA